MLNGWPNQAYSRHLIKDDEDMASEPNDDVDLFGKLEPAMAAPEPAAKPQPQPARKAALNVATAPSRAIRRPISRFWKGWSRCAGVPACI
jgi:hypothetical protein